MPSFMTDAQLGDQAAMQQELTPYLDKWRKTVEGSFPASLPPSSLPASFASSAEPRAAGAAPSEEPEHKPLVAMSHFASAKVKSSASGGMQQLDEFLKPAEEDSTAQEAAPASQEKTFLLQAPRMNIAILVVGTRGDVQPFVRIGKRLKDDGHRVRLGTHDQYEGFVRENGLEFYPLGGDPKKLSGYMCQSNGRLMPNMLSKEERDQIPEKMNMLEEMMLNTWPAVAMPHPEGAPDFHADAVIANPVAYGHVHVAEKLDIPVHLMFPQPWSPTGDLPHPLSILGGGCGERDFRPSGLDAMVKRAQNQATYYAIDEFLYAGMRYMTNDFRKKIGLEKIRAGEDGAHILNTHKVPFAYQWSPLLIPRPEDYDDQLEVTGTIFNEAGPEYLPPPDLEAFINKCNEENKAAVFVGFGSMMIADPQELANTIVEAARLSDTHVILQSSWSTFDLADEDAKKLVFQLGNCPHDWLFSKVTAVVHHGGAGTAAAGIRAGIPTMICPFFGDQHLWGQAFHHKGLGVEPCPIQDLTPQVLAAAFTTMRGLNQEGALMRRKCQRVGRELQQEDGVAGGVDCFYRHLPLEGLVCDASLLLRPVRDVRMARWFSPRLGLKLCPEAYDALRRALPRQDFDRCEFQRYHYGMAWGFSEPRSFSSSVRQGWMHLATRYAQAGAGLLAEPIKGVYQGGAENGLVGVLSGGVEGTISGAKQFFHHLKYSTRRAVMRPLQALCGGSESRGGRKVHADEVGFHSYLPDEELSEDQRKQWLEAFNAALALHQVWAAQAPSEGRPGDHKALPLRTVAALMLELQYASEVLDALALQYGMTIEDDAPAGAAAEDTEDRNERLRKKFQLRLSCFEAKAAIPRRRDVGNSIFDSDLPLQFEAVAALLQPHGPAPNVYGISTEELVRDVLVKGPSTS